MAKAYFYIYETVDLPIVLSDKDALQDYERIVVSISQAGYHSMNISDGLGIDVEAGTINVHLSQEDTSKFKKGSAIVQVNIKYLNTERDVSAMAQIDILDNLYKEIME